MKKINAGDLLIAEPYIPDERFFKSVILIVEIDEEGVVGFILNKPLSSTMISISDLPVSPDILLGGPVNNDMLFFIHQRPDIISDSRRIDSTNMYWGGNYKDVFENINNGTLNTDEVLFFSGYSGWAVEQLGMELSIKSWIVSPAIDSTKIFNGNREAMWEERLQDLGQEYAVLTTLPSDISLN